MGLDYVDIFYSHRFDPTTPLEETMGALDTAVRAGQGALRRHLVVLGRADARGGARSCAALGTPLLIHQPSYSMLNRWIEDGLLDALGELGVGCIAFSPLAQGMLTDKYLDGIPAGSRASRGTDALAGPARRRRRSRRSARSNGSRAAAARRSRSWRSRGCCAIRASRRHSSAPRASSSSRRTSPRSTGPTCRTRSSPPIDGHATESDINIWRAATER